MIEQLDLTPGPATYMVGEEMWKVTAWGELRAEMEGLEEAGLLEWHMATMPTNRGWMVARRLFGVMPVVPSPETSPDDLRVWSRKELMEALQITRAQMSAELDALRGTWKAALANWASRQLEDRRQAEARAAAIAPEIVKPAVDDSGNAMLKFKVDDLLAQYGLGRMKFIDQDERQRFSQRVSDFEQLLKEKMSEGLARNALMTELQMWRTDAELSDPDTCRVGSERWQSMVKIRKGLEATYSDQIEQILKSCPWAGKIAGRYDFRGVLSDITAAYQLYYAKGDRKLIDGVMTAAEIEVELRVSVQVPTPRYRAGLVVYLAEARAGLMDPNWRSKFTAGQLKKLDAGWTAAAIAAGAAEEKIDLAVEGEEFTRG